MIKPEQVPDAVWSAFHEAVLRYGYKPQAIAAALNAWPGMTTEFRRDSYMGWDGNLIILPLTQENSDDPDHNLMEGIV